MTLAEQPGWVGLDGRNLALSQGTGVATYARSLAKALTRLGLRREVLTDQTPGAGKVPEYGKRRSGFGRMMQWLEALPPGDRPTQVTAVPGTRAGFDRARWAEDIFRTAQVHFDVYGRPLGLTGTEAPDVMHWTYPLPMIFRGVPNICTIHDVIPLSDLGMSNIPVARYRRLLDRLVTESDHIVTVSEASRLAIITTLNCPPEKVTNTYQAVETPPAPDEAVAPFPELAAGGFFLFIGTIEKRKNIGRLIEAYLASGSTTPLLLIGRRGWQAEDELAPANGHLTDPSAIIPGRAAIVPLGHLPEAQVQSLFRRAKALLFPSLAEGFGLPIIEAMTLGVPVMTSRGGATGEVADHAAMLVDPLDVRHMAAAITAIDTHAALRSSLILRGRARAALFAPERYAERLRAVYQQVPALAARLAQAELTGS